MDMRDLLPRSPRARWDGFFLIGIFPPDCPVRWLKFHLFVGADRPGRVPIAAMEGMEGEGELFEAICLEDRLFTQQHPTSLDALRSTPEPFSLSLLGRFEMSGAWPDFSMAVTDPAHGMEGRFRVEARDRQTWCRLGNVLSYFGLHSGLRGDLRIEGKDHALDGFGILEHAWGTDTRIPMPRLVRGVWHWDVLWFGRPEEPDAAVAALAVAPFGIRVLPFRGGGRVPGEPFRAWRGLRVEYLETREVEGEAVPVQWRGTVESRAGTIRYKATAAGPVLRPFEHGAFLGFTFEGSYEPRSGPPRPVAGTGFTEFFDSGAYSAGPLSA